jgi:two-component system CheB/CheR fusion protein
MGDLDKEIRELFAKVHHTRRQFLKAELQTCMTALEIAQFELSIGNTTVAQREIAAVDKGVSVIQQFLPALPEAQRGEIDTKLAELSAILQSVKARYGAELCRSEAQLRALAARMITAQEDESRRLARELHDDICQRLAVLELDAHQIQSKIRRNPDVAMRDLSQLRIKIGSLSEDLRNISHALHPSLIDDLGIVAALRSLVEEFRAGKDMAVTFMPENIPAKLSPQIATGLYRISQEALRNIAKHSREGHVTVILKGSGSRIRLQIEDLGPGFDVNASRSGLGLTSMEERARIMHGSFSIESEPGKGTTVTVDVPLESGNET